MNNNLSDAITVILTVWKRNHLEEQLQALFQQTVPPFHIWVQQSLNHIDVSHIIKQYSKKICYFHFEENPGVFGRFESVTEVQTPFVCILDDDQIPGKRFLENALEACKRLNAIISPHGRWLSPQTNQTERFVGDGFEFQHSFCLEDTKVDFGNNAWFFRKEWITHFLSVPPLFRNNGEDIHLSATSKLSGDIPTYVPKQIVPSESGNVKRIYSGDSHALHKKPLFSEERIKVIRRFRQLNWHLLSENKENDCANQKSPSISVVMAITEKNRNITPAVESIRKQTWDDWELILVDRREGKSLTEYKDNRIRRIKVGGDLSKYTLLNIGCGIAKGKYICFMDPHFISHPDRLHSQYSFMEKKGEIVAAAESSDGENLLWPSLIIRRKVLHQVKYYNELLEEMAEQDLLYRLLQKGDIILLENIFISPRV